MLLLGSRPTERLIALARRAEQAGFDVVWIPDERFFRDVYVLAGAIAQQTEWVRLGPCVTDPYTRRPELTAMAMATLDEISAGRAVLGIGAGISGFRELRIVRDPPPVSAVRHGVAAFRDLLGDPSGGHLRLDFTALRSTLPVYVAAEGPRMLRLAGEIGDGVILQAKVAPTTFAAALTTVAEGAAAGGRHLEDLEVVTRVDVSLANRLADAYDALRPRVIRRLIGRAPRSVAGVEIARELREAVAGLAYTHDPAVLSRVGSLVPDELVDVFCVPATPTDLPERLTALARAGATQVLINPVAPDDAVEPLIEAAGGWRRAGE